MRRSRLDLEVRRAGLWATAAAAYSQKGDFDRALADADAEIRLALAVRRGLT